MAAPPIIPTLPAAPSRNDAPVDFSTKADAFVAAMPPTVAKQNELATWMNANAAEAVNSANAAATSAANAADSATLAGQKVGLAADQVALAADQVSLAVTERQGAEAARDDAEAYAQAAGASAGVPTPIANRFLGTDGLGAVGWRAIVAPVIPPPLLPGQILISAVVPDATHILANGAVRLKADYPELAAALGPNVVTPPVTALSGPSTSFGGNACTLSPGALYLAVSTGSATVYMYKRTGDVLALIQTITLPGSGGSKPAFTSDSVYMAVPMTNAPYLAIYKRTGDTFNLLANPAVMPSNGAFVARFSPDGVHLVIGFGTGNNFIIYKRNGDVFTKLADPTVMPGSYVYGLAFSPDGVYLAVGTLSAPYLTIYKRAGDVFTKITGPATLPTSKVIALDYSPDGKALGMITNGPAIGQSYIGIYRQDGDVFTVPTQITPIVTDPRDCCFTPDGKYFAVANGVNNTAYLYPKVGDSLTSAYINLTNGYSSTVVGITIATTGATYMGTYTFVQGDNFMSWLRDGYPLNPVTEFKTPSLTITNGNALVDTTTKFPYPQNTAYVKAKSSL